MAAAQVGAGPDVTVEGKTVRTLVTLLAKRGHDEFAGGMLNKEEEEAVLRQRCAPLFPPGSWRAGCHAALQAFHLLCVTPGGQAARQHCRHSTSSVLPTVSQRRHGISAGFQAGSVSLSRRHSDLPCVTTETRHLDRLGQLGEFEQNSNTCVWYTYTQPAS